MAGVSIDALQSEFECFSVKIDDLIGRRLIELCDKFSLSAEEVSDQWMAYASGKKPQLTGQTIPAEHFGPFEVYLAQSKKVVSTPKANKKEPRSTSTPNRKALSGGLGLASKYEESLDADIDIASGYTTPQNRDKLAKRLHTTPEEDGMHKRMISENGSPHVARPTTKVELFRGDFASSSPSSPMTPSQNYLSRTNKGKVLEHFNCDSSFSFSSSSSSGLPPLVGMIDSASGKFLPHPPKTAFKYMMQRPREVAENLDNAVDDLLETFIDDHLGPETNEEESSSRTLSHVGVPHHERVLVGGRICCDGVGRINPKSLLLEGTRDSSGGASINLDVSQLQRYSFFPGQTVLMQGTNPSGRSFIASNLIASTKKSTTTTTTATTSQLHEDSAVFVAVGPFTTSDSDSYEPLEDFLKVVIEAKPRVCLFLGPFIDAKNELILDNNFQSGDGTHEGLFSVVFNRIKQCMDLLGGNCQAVLIPSSRDLHHAFVYPQPPFATEQNQLIKSFWDPSMLSIGGVLVGATSTDILFHLGAEEISFPPGSSDRLARLCSHILAQNSFYPLQPASEDVNMDYSLYERHATFSQKPQILILPSELKQFIKDVNGVVCVNPGRLAKGKVGGTFAKILLPSKSVSSKTIKSHIIKI